MLNTIYQSPHVTFNIDTQYGFWDFFNSRTGHQITSSTKDGTDPFMRSFPSLIDVGVMGSCQHGRSGLCALAGIECYQSGMTRQEPDMSLFDFKRIIDEIKGKTYQVALGGRGDPNKHADFHAIVKYAHDNGVVPNYTTSGLGLTQSEALTTRDYCGAVAVSWYRSAYTLHAIDMFVDAGCTTNIHYVLGNNSIDEAIVRLKNNDFPHVNAVIFLMHKPVGQGSESNVLSFADPRVAEFFALAEESHPFQIGFDSCSIPGVINLTHAINEQSIDTCEGARFSMYITSDMIATPCSFDQSLRYGFSLRDTTIQDAWNSDQFNTFRSVLSSSCVGCAKRALCYGGCPLTPQIVLCNRKES